MHEFLAQNNCGLWLVDVQEKLIPEMDRAGEVLETLAFLLKAREILGLPLIVTEQYPQGLGPTTGRLKKWIPANQMIYAKTTFSGYSNIRIREAVDSLSVRNWILVGIEAHICVLQTAKDLLLNGKKVVVLNDAITSRSIYDYSTAVGDLKDMGARITSVETVIYEILRDSSHPDFKALLSLVKQRMPSLHA
jgi:nicotinamidase-related amidase